MIHIYINEKRKRGDSPKKKKKSETMIKIQNSLIIGTVYNNYVLDGILEVLRDSDNREVGFVCNTF